MASARANGVDPRREKLLNFRRAGGTRCRCSYCVFGKLSAREKCSRLDRRRGVPTQEADDAR